jgi:tellurite resistance protein
VAYSDNPAGRLHNLLSQYGADPNATMENAWAGVLDVPVADLGLHIGRVANLFEDVKIAFQDVGDEGMSPILGHLQTLSRCVWPRDAAIKEPVARAAPDAVAMAFLGAFDTYLHFRSSEGDAPDTELVAELSVQVEEMIASIASAELDPVIKRMILNRLNEVLESLGHLKVGGPDAVRRATEALAAAAVTYGQDTEGENATLFEKLKKTASAVYTAFKVAATVTAAAHGLHSGIGTIDHVLWPPHSPHQIAGPPPSSPGLPSSDRSNETIADAEVVEDADEDDAAS